MCLFEKRGAHIIKPFNEPIYVTRPLFPSLDSYNLYLKNIWESKWLSNNGSMHEKLEERLGNLLKVNYISLFNNGTIALAVALKILDLAGEVITTPFTFPATVHALTWNKIEPVFCDISHNDMNIDVHCIENLITAKTSAILAVHVFGQPCDLRELTRIAIKYNLKLIYDAAHAFQLEVNGEGIGTYGDVSMFSFHPTKLFHTAEGGALSFTSIELKKRADLFKNFGILNEEEVVLPGINGKMNELQAAMGLAVLEILDKERKRRAEIDQLYRSELFDLDGLSVNEVQESIQPSYQYFVVRINENIFGKSRNYIYESLKKYNVFSRKYFYPLCSEFNHYKNIQSAHKSNLPVANLVAEEVLTLPFYGDLRDDDIKKICNILRIIKED